ncbi:MAG: response regulator [Alphaproteobacteria bacterium]|nr:response regulator [Alphaproteobacteria bacterium]
MAGRREVPEAAKPQGLAGGWLRLAAALVLAGLSAAAGFELAFASRHQLAPWLTLVLGLLAAIGLMGLLAATAGFVRFGLQSRQREFLDGLADAIGDPLIVTDGRGRTVYANGPYVALAGEAGAARLVGMDVLFAGYPEFASPLYKLAQAGLEGRPEECEIRIAAGSSAPAAKAAETVWLRIRVVPLAIAGGRPYTVWTLEDISDDRARQEQAFARLQFIITYLDHAPAGFYSTLPDGKVDYINATLAAWLGRDVTQGEELTLAKLAGEKAAAVLRGVTAAPGATVTEKFDLDLPGSDGKPLAVHIIHRVDFDAAGRPLPSRSLVVPREAATGLRKGEDGSALRLARFMEAVPLGIAEVDRKGVIQSANAALLALSATAKRGAKLADMIAESERPQLDQALAKVFAGEAQPVDIDAALAGATPRAVQFALTRLDAADNRAIVFAIDRTESKALEVQLAQSQKMQAVGQLASGIAHDFNNVLTPIIGFADLLLAKMRPTDPAFADVMSIKQNANRAANLVRQLLAFSRRQTLQPKVHSLTEAMSDLGNLLGRVLGEKVELKITHGRDLGLVLVDIHQFEQVIINLAVNARDAMANGGTLTVRTYNVSEEDSRAVKADLMPPGEYVAVEVEDRGTGIPPDILNKIWEPFFSTKEVGKGTGLGLSTVYGIVKQTGGFIFCDSALGKGTTFRIYLPRHYPEAPAPSETQAAEAAPKRTDLTGKGRILVVEDEDAVRAFAVRALTSRGYTVVEADSGESALARIGDDDKGFELILSDVVMPEMDGPALLRELRKRGNETRVIFVSGYPGEEFEKDLEGQTGFAFLPKPFSLKQLVEKVKEVMGE